MKISDVRTKINTRDIRVGSHLVVLINKLNLLKATVFFSKQYVASTVYCGTSWN